MRHNQQIQQQFGPAAERYVYSPAHAGGEDLVTLASWAEGGLDRIALDVATGGGHTALALSPHYREVIATDLTEEMLRAAEAYLAERAGNIRFQRADAESLPFPPETFDTVSCRIAAHHFQNVPLFVTEVHRVLKPGGIFLLEDTISPANPVLDTFLNQLERMRDSTHVRNLTVVEWLALLDQGGFVVERQALFPKVHDVEAWLERSATPAAKREAVRASLQSTDPLMRVGFEIQLDEGRQRVEFTAHSIVIRSRRP
ncbi:MAG: class I SAM-dependent methyltransferase [Chloroflexota bacterium]